jgi:hypothetical protein
MQGLFLAGGGSKPPKAMAPEGKGSIAMSEGGF